MWNWLSWLVSSDEYSSTVQSHQSNLNMLNGATVVMEEHPGLWRVAYAGSFWYAYSSNQSIFHSGDIVQVVGREGINLLIDKA